jgi:hypothetical protein
MIGRCACSEVFFNSSFFFYLFIFGCSPLLRIFEKWSWIRGTSYIFLLGAQHFVFQGQSFLGDYVLQVGFASLIATLRPACPPEEIGPPRRDFFFLSRSSTSSGTEKSRREQQDGPGHQSGPGSLTGSHNLFFVRLVLRGGRCSHGCFSIPPRKCGRIARASRHPGLMVILP